MTAVKKKKGDVSPSTRSIRYLEATGYLVADVEKHIPYSHIKQDLFGFADLIACKPDTKPQLIQVTTNDNLAARRTKILASHKALTALMSGFRIVLHGWLAPLKSRPDWTVRIEELTLDSFTDQPPPSGEGG